MDAGLSSGLSGFTESELDQHCRKFLNYEKASSLLRSYWQNVLEGENFSTDSSDLQLHQSRQMIWKHSFVIQKSGGCYKLSQRRKEKDRAPGVIARVFVHDMM